MNRLVSRTFRRMLALLLVGALLLTALPALVFALPPSSAKEIAAYSLPDGEPAAIDSGAHTVAVTVPYGTDLTHLIATFSLSAGATATVGAVCQVSGTTANDFTGTVHYLVTAQDSSTQDWAVTVTVAPNTEKAFTAYSINGVSGIIDSGAHTVSVTLPYGTDTTHLVATFTLSPQASATAGGGAPQTSGVTANDFSYSAGVLLYFITAGDGTVADDWLVTVTVTPPSTATAITAFGAGGQAGNIDGTYHTVTIRLPYGADLSNLAPSFTLSAGATASVGGIGQQSGVSAHDFSTQAVHYLVTAQDGSHTQDWTVYIQWAENTATAMTSFSAFGGSSMFPWAADGVIDSNSHTVIFTVPWDISELYGIANFTLSYGATATVGGTVQVSNSTAQDFASPVTYRVTAQDGSHTQDWTVTGRREAGTDITSFSVAGVAGSIDSTHRTVTVNVPYGTDLTDALVTFGLSGGASASVNGAAQDGSGSGQNFTSPVVYRVTAWNGDARDWTVTVLAESNTAAAITAYSLGGVSGQINSGDHTVAVTLPYGSSLTNQIATFTLSGGATAKVGAVSQSSGSTANNFSSPVTYTVTAQDGVHQQDWTVTAAVALRSAKAITAYSLAGVSGSINAGDHRIAVILPAGSGVTDLTATFSLSAGASAAVGATVQASGSTPNNFTSPVTYRVTAEDGTTQDWTVSVSVAAGTATEITAFSLPGASGATDSGAHTVDLTLPYGSTLTSLTPTFSLSDGATATVNGVTQVSGSHSHDFTSPVIYRIIAQDGVTAQNWTVTVHVGANAGAEITEFIVAGRPGRIDSEAHIISLTLPYGFSRSDAVADFTLSDGATATVNGIAQVSGSTANNFDTALTYRVTAQDGHTTRDWTVTARVLPNTAANFTSFSLAGVSGIVGRERITVTLPYGTDLTHLVPSFNLSAGAMATFNGVPEGSGSTDHDFSSSLTYDVIAEDGSTRSWTVTVKLAPNNKAELTDFSVDGEAGRIDPGAHTVTVPVYGSGTTSLVASFTLSDKATATVNGTLQESGVTPNDFTDPVTYVVTAQDGLTRSTWKVIVVARAKVTTLPVADITPHDATLHGQVSPNTEIKTCGFVIAGTEYEQKLPIRPLADGSFNAVPTGLTPGVSYLVIAYCEDARGTISGLPVTFTTEPTIPKVETGAPAAITPTGATLSGSIVTDHGFAVTESGLLWGADGRPDARLLLAPGADGRSLTTVLKGLTPGTAYHVQAYAVNSEGTGYGQVLTFKTQSTSPVVITGAPISDGVSIQNAALSGSIESSGGAAITEYGFEYIATYGKAWQRIVVGKAGQVGPFAASLNARPLDPDEFYVVRAYAINAIGISYGETLNTPRLPYVEAWLDVDTVTESAATLMGRYSWSQGRAGVPKNWAPTVRGFQYRPLGSGDWADVGLETGSFDVGYIEYRFSLTGLKPAGKYEFRAKVQNVAGWQYSQPVHLTMAYGKTDKDAATNMKAAGYGAAENATVLKRVFKDSPGAAVLALTQAGYGAVEIAAGLQGSEYHDRYYNTAYYESYEWAVAVAGMLKDAGFDSLSVAEALAQVFPRQVTGTSPFYDHADWGVTNALKKVGFGDDDLLKVLKERFKLGAGAAGDALIRGMNYNFYDKIVLPALVRTYGFAETGRWVWSNPYQLERGQGSATGRFVYNMKRAGADSLQIATLLKGLDPALTAREAADLYQANGYTAAETGAMLTLVLGADGYGVGAALQVNYHPEQIADYLIDGLHVSALDLARIMGPIYSDPETELPPILTTRFKLSGPELARTLYQAGWTEVNDGYGPRKDRFTGLRTIISYLVKSLGMGQGEVIGILRDLGLPPLTVGQIMINVHDLFGARYDEYFLAAYRQQGYSVVDAAMVLKRYPSHQTVEFLTKMGGYSLKETVLAVKTVYGLDGPGAIKVLTSGYAGITWPWKADDAARAVAEVYGEDPYLVMLQNMKQAGTPANDAAWTLNRLLGTGDPMPVADYLVKAGYGESDVLYAMTRTFASGGDQVAAFRLMAEVLQKVFRKNAADLVQTLPLQAMGVKSPLEAIRLLQGSGYSLNDIAPVLKEFYHLSASDAIDVLKRSALFKQDEILAWVQVAYQVDPILAQLQAKKSLGMEAATAAALLRKDGMTDPVKLGGYLLQAGYGPNEVLNGLARTFAPAGDQVAAFRLMAEIGPKVFQKNSSESVVSLLLQAMGVSDQAAAIRLLQGSGYNLSDIVAALKEFYHLSANDAIDLLQRSALFKNEEILAWVQVLYQVDPILAQLQAKKSLGWGADSAAGSLREQGITDPVTLGGYLIQAGYGQADVLDALARPQFPTAEGIALLNQVVKALYPQEKQRLKVVLNHFQMLKPEMAIYRLKDPVGYNISQIAAAVKEAWGVTAGELLDELGRQYPWAQAVAAVQAIFPGEDWVLSYLQWRKRSCDSASCAYYTLRELGFTDGVKMAQYLMALGYSRSDVLGALAGWPARLSFSVVLKQLYGVTDPVVMAQTFRDDVALNKYVGLDTDEAGIPKQLQRAFPTLSTGDVAMVMKAAGYPVDRYHPEPGVTYKPVIGGDLFHWLRGIEMVDRGRRDDSLAAVLGPGKLGLQSYWAAEVLKAEGYTPLEIGNWLKADDYTLTEILVGLQLVYGEPQFGDLKALGTMKAMGYGAGKLFEAEAGLIDPSDQLFGYAWATKDLYDIGYDFREVTQGYVDGGGPVQLLPRLLWDLSSDLYLSYDHRFGELQQKGLIVGNHLSATAVATYMYDAMAASRREDLNLVDLAKGFLSVPPDRYRRSEVFHGIQSIAKRYVRDQGMDDDVSNPAAMAILRQAGQSADDAVLMLRDEREGWDSALAILLVAGYNFGDLMSSLWNHYHDEMGAFIVQLMDGKAYEMLPKLVTKIALIKKLVDLSFAIGLIK